MRQVTLAGRVRIFVAVLLVLIAVSGAVAWTTVRARERAIDLLDMRIEPARASAGALFTAIVDQETGVHGYVFTADDALLERYREGRQAEERLLAHLRALLADDPDLRPLVDDVAESAEEWRTAAVEPQLAAAEAGNGQAAVDLATRPAGRQAFDDLHADVAQLLDRLRQSQVEARDEFDAARRRVTAVLVANLILGTVIALAAALLVNRWVTRPLGAVSAAAREVAGGALNRPIPSVGPPEIAALGTDTERMRRRVVAELDAAVRAQQALAHRGPLVALLREELGPTHADLPGNLRLAARFLPASGVLAGDWYDAFVRDDRVLAALVDVSGHGPSAGVFALRAKQMVAAALTEDLAPGQALGWVARHFGDTGDAFLTGLLLEIDPGTGHCRYANAGHPPALLADASGVTLLPPTGPILGPLSGSWETAEARLTRHGLLVAYTDAVVESRSPTGEEFGSDRLVACVDRHHREGPERTLDACLDAVRDFSNATLSDDLTLIAIAWSPPD